MAAAPFSPGGKPVLIGKAHKLLWKQDIDLDVEVYKLQPVFGHMYCVHAVNVETAKPYPKLYVAYDSLKRILATKKIVDEKKAVFELLTTGMEVVTNTFTDGEGKEATRDTVKLQQNIHAGETIELGSPKVRSKKRTTIVDFENSKKALAEQTQLLSGAAKQAEKQQMVMKFAMLAFKQPVDYHDNSPKGRWHRAMRKVMFFNMKEKVEKRLDELAARKK